MISKKTMEASFPSSSERTVASALLLLSCSISREKSTSCTPPESYGSYRFSVAKSGDRSSEASFGGESAESPISYVPRFCELKLKVIRKKRTKSIWITKDKKLTPIKPKPTCAPTSSDCASVITSADTLSCFSSSSSTQSCSAKTKATDKKKSVITTHMGNQAKAILNVLSNGDASEVRIRQLLGDSPTTSKALRMLLKQEKVKRRGGGGRNDPYIYTIA